MAPPVSAGTAASAPAPARVPCPACGGLIHPVASRCKHCKQALTGSERGLGSRAAGLVALPALSGSAVATAAVADGRIPGHVAAISGVGSAPVMLPMRRPAASTGTVARPGLLARRWPLLMIAIAALAIVVAVIMMMWPPRHHPATAMGTEAPPPAPSRMDTQIPETPTPMPPMPGAVPPQDPWGTGQPPLPPAQVAPDDNAGADSNTTADDVVPSQTPADAIGGLLGGVTGDDIAALLKMLPDPLQGGAMGSLPADVRGLLTNVSDHVCTKVAACGVSLPFALCQQLSHQLAPVLLSQLGSGSCVVDQAAQQRCLAAIDSFPCAGTASAVSLMATLSGASACTSTLTCE